MHLTTAYTPLRSRSDLRAVVRLAVPAIAHSLLQTLVFLVDRLMLGHHSEVALAAMQTAGPVLWSVYSLFGAFAVGTVATVGRAIGAREPHEATGAARGSIVIALLLGSVVGVLGFVLVEPMLAAFGGGGGDAVRRVSGQYLRVVLPAMPVFFLGLTTTSILQAAGDTRTPFLIGVISNVVNIVGNWFLIFGHHGAPRLGATGAAISTVLAAVLEALLGLWVLLRSDSVVCLRRVPGVNTMAGARRVLQLSWGSWGERVVYHAGYLAYVGFVVGLGPAAMAANQALLSIESISFLTADGCAVAAGALVAQRLGARQPDGARSMGWLTAGLCSAMLAGCALVFLAIPEPLVRAFRDDPTIVSMGARALRVAAAAQVPMAIGVVLAQAMRGAGATREALMVSFLGALLVRLGATYLFVTVLNLGLTGVWLGSTADWFVRAAVYAWRWQRGSWASV